MSDIEEARVKLNAWFLHRWEVLERAPTELFMPPFSTDADIDAARELLAKKP